MLVLLFVFLLNVICFCLFKYTVECVKYIYNFKANTSSIEYNKIKDSENLQTIELTAQ